MCFSLKKWRLEPITHVQMCFSSSCFQCSALLHNNTEDMIIRESFDSVAHLSWIFIVNEIHCIKHSPHFINILHFCCYYGNGHWYWIRTIVKWPIKTWNISQTASKLTNKQTHTQGKLCLADAVFHIYTWFNEAMIDQRARILLGSWPRANLCWRTSHEKQTWQFFKFIWETLKVQQPSQLAVTLSV